MICLDINKPANCCDKRKLIATHGDIVPSIIYLFELLLVPQVEGDVKQRQEGVDKLKECHFSDQMIIVL